MRGREHNISRDEILNYMENHTMKQCAEHFNLPLTTIASRLEKYGFYPWHDRKSTIELTPENIAYIESHTLNEGHKYFHMFVGSYRNFVNKHRLNYVRETIRKAPDENIRIERQQKYIKMHETMSLEEIGQLEGICKQRVSQIIKYGI